MSSRLFATHAFLLALSLVTPAEALTPLGSISVPAYAVDAQAAADGKRLVTQLQATAQTPATLQVIDSSDPTRPKVTGTLVLPDNGDMVLDGGGRLALVHLHSHLEPPSPESNHRVIAIDIDASGVPRILWEQELSASQLTLSAQAKALAYLRLAASNDGAREAVVMSVADRKTRAVIPIGFSGDQTVALSPEGDVLATVGYGDVRIWDLKAGAPVPFEHVASASGREIVSGCVPAVLETGHVVVLDGRRLRWGVYKAAPSLPRIATLDLEVSPLCNALNPNAPDAGFIYADNVGHVSRVSLRNPAAPRFDGSWLMPAGEHAIAAFGDTLVTSSINADALRWWRLDSKQTAPFDWAALAAAHRSAMASRKSAQGAYDHGNWDAVSKLEAAGIHLALESTVTGISNRQVAAILNDYGFVAWQTTSQPTQVVERALRRAIALDPSRAVAHLNLADLLRQGLGSYAANGGNARRRTKEIEQHYRAYVASGGRANAAAAEYLRGDPAAGLGNDCDAIAAWSSAGRLQELLASGGTGLRWNDRSIDLVFTQEGTAHVPTYYAWDASNDQPLDQDSLSELFTVPETAWGGDDLALLSLRGQHYILQLSDPRHPTEASPLNGGETCRFTVSTRESIGARALEPELCTALQTDSAIDAIEFDEGPSPDHEALQLVWRETSVTGTRELDVLNDGLLANVAEMSVENASGAGCAETFFELLNDDGTQILKGPVRDRLMALQGAHGEGRYPIQCGGHARLLSHRGQTYVEVKPSTWPPLSEWDEYHRVATLRDGKVIDVCDFKFKSSVSSIHGARAAR